LEIAKPAPQVQAANAMSGAAALGREHRRIMRKHVSDMTNPHRMAGAVEVLPGLEAPPIKSGTVPKALPTGTAQTMRRLSLIGYS